jgi:chromosomal replication initiation ATPase DnaA
MADRRQMVLDLPHRPALERDDFLVAPCNADAVGWIDNWPEWPGSALVLCGPAGCGKTHLAAVWQARSGALAGDAAALPEAAFPCDEEPLHRLLEDAARTVDEGALLHVYNRIVERGGTLLLTAETPPVRWPVRLPDLASRLRALPVAGIGRPDDTLVEALLVKMLAERQLRASPEVIAYLLPRMERSFAAARDLVVRLDAAALLAQRRTITVPLARAVLADAGRDRG